MPLPQDSNLVRIRLLSADREAFLRVAPALAAGEGT